MKKLFNHILVPVSVNRDGCAAVEKAIQAANRFDCDIHLLYVHPPSMSIPFVYEGNFTGSTINSNMEQAEIKLKELVEEFKPKLADGLLMTYTLAVGSWAVIIKEQVITRHIDLIVLPRAERNNEKFHKLDVNQLTQQTQCPVLTVTDEFDAHHLQNIVVPVDDFLPIKKLTAATYLARKFNGVIHLMGGRSESFTENKVRTRSLTRAYQLLNDYTNVKVYCSSLDGHTMAEDTLTYAQQVKADLIVVNSGKESLLGGWFSKWMGNYLYKNTTIPVLTISRN